MTHSQAMRISINHKFQMDFILLNITICKNAWSHFVHVYLLSLGKLHLQPRVWFFQCVSRYLFFYLGFLSCECVCVGHNWLHVSSGSSVTQDNVRRRREADLLFLLPLTYFIFSPHPQDSQQKRAFRNHYIYIYIYSKSLQKGNQSAVRTSCAAEIQSGEKK